MRYREVVLAAMFGVGCTSGEVPIAHDNDPPLANLNELMDGAPMAKDLPREWEDFDIVYSKYTGLAPLMSPVKSQGRRGVCSIFATTGLMEHLYIAAGYPNPDFSEQFLQWSTKFETGAFPETSGSNDGVNLTTIAHYGIPQESAWPYEKDQWGIGEDPACDGEDTQPTYCYTNGHPTDEAKNAPRFFLPSPHYLLNPLDIKGYISTKHTAVVAGMTFFYQSWNHSKSELPTNPAYWNQGYVLYPNAKDQEVSTTEEKSAGHAIVILGWDDELEVPIVDEFGEPVLDADGNPTVEKGFYIFKNSWGTAGFGIDHELGPGYGYISKRYIHEYASVRAAKLPPAPPAEICDDGIDNNLDLGTDCGDSTCAGAVECAPGKGILVFPGSPYHGERFNRF